MVVKLPTHDVVKTEPASLLTGARIKTGKFAGLPAPTKGEKSQTLNLFYKGELISTYHSYRPRPGSAFTWRVVANKTGGAKKTNYSILAKALVQAILHEHGIHLSNAKHYKFGQGNLMNPVGIEYAKHILRTKTGSTKLALTPGEVARGMYDWLQTGAGKNVIVNFLIPRIREEIAKGNAGLAVSGSRKIVDITALAAGSESAFSPKRQNKHILNLGSISGAGIAPKRTATRAAQAAPSVGELEDAFGAGVEAERAHESNRSPKRSRSAARPGAGSL